MQTIGQSAFYYCENLSSVVFAEGSQLKEIRERAFYDCDNLKSVTVPKSAEVHPEAFGSSVRVAF